MIRAVYDEVTFFMCMYITVAHPLRLDKKKRSHGAIDVGTSALCCETCCEE